MESGRPVGRLIYTVAIRFQACDEDPSYILVIVNHQDTAEALGPTEKDWTDRLPCCHPAVLPALPREAECAPSCRFRRTSS